MIIRNPFTGVTKQQGIEVQRSIEGILFCSDGDITTEKVEISILSTTGKRRELLVDPIPVRALFEFAGQNEGLFIENVDGSGVNTQTFAHVTMGEIQLSALGAVELEDGEYFSIDLTDLVSGRTYTLYGLESLVLGAPEYVWKRDAISAKTRKKTIDTTDLATVVIPVTSNLDSLDLISDDSDVEMHPAELQYRQLKENDLVKVTAHALTDEDVHLPIFGFGAYYFINVADVNRLTININDDNGLEFFTVGINGLNSEPAQP